MHQKFLGLQQNLKEELITEISATLSFSALQNNDKVGVILFSDQIELFIPPKKGKSHILRIIRELIEFKPNSKRTSNILRPKLFNASIKRSLLFLYYLTLLIVTMRTQFNLFRKNMI